MRATVSAMPPVRCAIGSFRFRKNDELELLTTVDFAALDLKKANNPITLDAIRRIIATHREWSAKLKREVFSILCILDRTGILPPTDCQHCSLPSRLRRQESPL
jgi:hypothetical protein